MVSWLCVPFDERSPILFFFFFNDTATTEIYTLSLHDALPICPIGQLLDRVEPGELPRIYLRLRSEEHTSELQSRSDLVCRLLLEKKKTQYRYCAGSQSIAPTLGSASLAVTR